jgi:hypothetical protein
MERYLHSMHHTWQKWKDIDRACITYGKNGNILTEHASHMAEMERY